MYSQGGQMRICALLLILLIPSTPLKESNTGVQTRDYHEEIDSLLKQLSPVERNDGQQIVMEGPSLEVQQYVPNRLLQIANESPDSRNQVVQALIKILEDP